MERGKVGKIYGKLGGKRSLEQTNVLYYMYH